jgi:hypothetical protein
MLAQRSLLLCRCRASRTLSISLGRAVPELSDVEGGVEGCGRVSSAALPLVTRRRGLAIHTEAVELVAAGTRDVVVLRQESDREIGSPLATSNS